ncbi:class I SAM-dependent methyltransferase [Saccharopolyspora gregorii]|uniref:class I SAM-dependent methyltransferase n=1 Tax=Saccharopolyspora gregorii TaxID=33914 RepID=UPI0021AC75F9|nr:class I SAM-dependent methyltransferase [Saccharopolyspora gregorii]
MPTPHSSHPPRRGSDPRPYPGAPDRTRPHHARPATTRRRREHSPRGKAAAAIPSSVWAPPAPIDPALAWPPALIRQITTAFTEPGARVGLLPWPRTNATEHTPELDEQADDALAVIDRTGRVAVLDQVPNSGPAVRRAVVSRPFWDGLITPDAHHTALAPEHAEAVRGLAADVPNADLDLIITSLSPDASGDAVTDLVALHAARRLRTGGTLAVLTHSHQNDGVLVDPTGSIVAAGQNADLLYLQHLVVLHTPLHRHPLTPPDTTTPETTAESRARQVTPHRRIHSDLLVFAQPTDHANGEHP